MSYHAQNCPFSLRHAGYSSSIQQLEMGGCSSHAWLRLFPWLVIRQAPQKLLFQSYNPFLVILRLQRCGFALTRVECSRLGVASPSRAGEAKEIQSALVIIDGLQDFKQGSHRSMQNDKPHGCNSVSLGLT